MAVAGTVVTGEVAGSVTVQASIWVTHTMTTMIAATIAAVGGFAVTKSDFFVVLALPGLLQRSGFIYSNGGALSLPCTRIGSLTVPGLTALSRHEGTLGSFRTSLLHLRRLMVCSHRTSTQGQLNVFCIVESE